MPGSGTSGNARAAEPLVLTVPAGNAEGYGITECLRTGGDCGRAMANALCEAHGHVRAVAFGAADDVTGSVPLGGTMISASVGDVIVRCTD